MASLIKKEVFVLSVRKSLDTPVHQNESLSLPDPTKPGTTDIPYRMETLIIADKTTKQTHTMVG